MQWLITAPANNERGPRYMEKALAAMHQAGLRQLAITLVYGSVAGEIGEDPQRRPTWLRFSAVT